MNLKIKENYILKLTIIVVSILIAISGFFIPSFNGLSKDAIEVITIFLGTLILWLTISISWPSLLCMFLLGFVDSIGFNSVYSSSFGNSTFFFLLFTFLASYALGKTVVIKKIAFFFTTSKIARKNGVLFIFSFLFSVLLIGIVTSPSVLFIVMLPILNEILEILEIPKNHKIAKFMMIGLGFSVSISSGMSTIAHVFPVLAMNASGVEISTFKYLLVGIPSGFILFILMFFTLLLFLRPDFSNVDFSKVVKLKDEVDKMKKKDIIVLSIFILVLILWIVPSFLEYFLEDFYTYINGLSTAMPPILGVLLLSIIEIEEKPLLNIEEGLKNGVPWGSLLMCASTLTIGSALQNSGVGLIEFLKVNLSSSLVSLSPILLLFIFVIWSLIQTNFSSNMVTATLVSSVCFSILSASETLILDISAMALVIGMLSSFAFLTAPSMPHIALVVSSESASSKDCLFFGSFMILYSTIIALLISYPLATLIL